MQRLSTKYGVAYTISHCARQQWRWNTTAAASASFAQPNRRLAANYGDIEIPAQGETVNPEPWRPDTESVEAHAAGRTVTSDERRQRILAAEQQRREERHATQLHNQQRGQHQRPSSRSAEVESAKRKMRIEAAELKRREERLAEAEAAIHFPTGEPTAWRPTRPQSKQSSKRPVTRSQTKAKAAEAKKANQPRHAVVPAQSKTLAEEDEDGADITMEEIENGGDVKAPAAFQDAEFTPSDLDTLFHSSSLPRYTLTAQAIREKLGGHYFRYSPRDIPADRTALSPTQQVNLIFAKRKDVPINLRQDAASIVSSYPQSTETKVARSS